ncbi:hypothetical protein H0H81_007333 [Sphagnurus paluster]|uniref:Aldehyde dehydrogenase domain-containing protein n=1 Tax=Sphagnurus paluster TaxID=117069 RepID=A0A9P7KKK2_9AGAR|nr:hypothetical protein H0H81_007333 [Sphagnurus paluster]
MSSNRVIVQASIASALVDAIKALSSPLQLGPLFTTALAQNVIDAVKEAVNMGAELVLGDAQAHGAMVHPQVLLGISPGMLVWDRETFGPVLGIAVVDTVEDAVQLANASEYSLTAGLWTTNMYAAQDVASRIRAGFVNINGSTVHSEPLVGARGLSGASGYGRFDVDSFTDVRVVVTHPPGRIYPLVGGV